MLAWVYININVSHLKFMVGSFLEPCTLLPSCCPAYMADHSGYILISGSLYFNVYKGSINEALQWYEYY